MSQTKYLRGECTHCGGAIGFPAESIGMTSDCPHCGQTTELLLAQPKEEPSIPHKTIVWTAIAVTVLVLGLGGAIAALHMAEKKVARKKEAAASAPVVTNAAPEPDPEDPAVKAGFRISEIKLEKAKGSSLMYAVGTLTNATNRQRFGVTVEMDLLDAAGKRLGGARDYQQTIEPNGQWQFKALVVESKAANVKVVSVSEQQ